LHSDLLRTPQRQAPCGGEWNVVAIGDAIGNDSDDKGLVPIAEKYALA
jgi:hypothetical protein